jgi:formate-dependent nitrite reductase membrane component NrfD/ferredoxin
VTALFKRDDGIVDFDNRRCIGCKACTQACPYDALYIDPQTHTAAKCNYCAHRVDIGLEPACVNVCPEHAIISGDLDNPFSEISQLLAREQVTARKVEKGTRPKLFYIEGDEASLKPIVTAPASSYMWSSQATGVGHFAHYAEARMSSADPAKMAEQLSGEWAAPAGVSGGEGDGERVLVPHGGDEKMMQQKAQEVIKEKALRVYDAPSKGAVWGWEVSAYVWTKAICAGTFLIPFVALISGFVAVSETAQWLGLAVSLIFLTLTGVLLVKDLDKPMRFAYVLLRPQWGSWLVRGGYIIAAYGGLLMLCGAAKFFVWNSVSQIALWGSAIFAVLTAVYTAFLFAQAKGRDFWQSPTLSLHMLVHAVMAGAALFGILTMFLQNGEEWRGYLRSVLLISLAVNLIVIAAELITTHPTEDAKRTVRMIVAGRFRALFWLGALIIGNVAPLLLLGFGAPMLALASVLVLVGIYITEHIWIRAPQLIPLC